jgi:anti-sigma regulatory factor (Ser/Thr protein kinase)
VSGARGSINGNGSGAGAGLRRAFVQLYFAIPSTESGIASAIKAIKESMETIAVVDDWIRRAELSLQEALINGHHHGNGSDPGKELRVGCSISPLKLEIFVEDDGSGYPGPTDFSVPRPTRGHGRGLFLIHQLMDRVAITANGSRIVMYLGGE